MTSAIVVPMPQLDDVVGRWRVTCAAPGMPAHVTLLYPFKPAAGISEHEVAGLRRIVGAVPAGSTTFERCGRFPGVLYLAPDHDDRFRRLTSALADAWPDWQPYGGAFDDVVPHLTVVEGGVEAELDAIERELAPRLPLVAPSDEAWLVRFDGTEWRRMARLPFATS